MDKRFPDPKIIALEERRKWLQRPPKASKHAPTTVAREFHQADVESAGNFAGVPQPPKSASTIEIRINRPGAEKRAERLKNKFQRVSSRHHNRKWWRQTAASGLVIAAAAAILTHFSLEFGSIEKAARHIWAFYPDCAANRAVGLAPAKKGKPGYWPWHDADEDGIACELNPGRRWEVDYLWL